VRTKGIFCFLTKFFKLTKLKSDNLNPYPKMSKGLFDLLHKDKKEFSLSDTKFLVFVYINLFYYIFF
jgi:hypothetical protein